MPSEYKQRNTWLTLFMDNTSFNWKTRGCCSLKCYFLSFNINIGITLNSRGGQHWLAIFIWIPIPTTSKQHIQRSEMMGVTDTSVTPQDLHFQYAKTHIFKLIFIKKKITYCLGMLLSVSHSSSQTHAQNGNIHRNCNLTHMVLYVSLQ